MTQVFPGSPSFVRAGGGALRGVRQVVKKIFRCCSEDSNQLGASGLALEPPLPVPEHIPALPKSIPRSSQSRRESLARRTSGIGHARENSLRRLASAGKLTEIRKPALLEGAKDATLEGEMKYRIGNSAWRVGQVIVLEMSLAIYDSPSVSVSGKTHPHPTIVMNLGDKATRLTTTDAFERILVLQAPGLELTLQGGAIRPYYGEWVDLIKRKLTLRDVELLEKETAEEQQRESQIGFRLSPRSPSATPRSSDASRRRSSAAFLDSRSPRATGGGNVSSPKGLGQAASGVSSGRYSQVGLYRPVLEPTRKPSVRGEGTTVTGNDNDPASGESASTSRKGEDA